jgi:hypothetical protein
MAMACKKQGKNDIAVEPDRPLKGACRRRAIQRRACIKWPAGSAEHDLQGDQQRSKRPDRAVGKACHRQIGKQQNREEHHIGDALDPGDMILRDQPQPPDEEGQGYYQHDGKKGRTDRGA